MLKVYQKRFYLKQGKRDGSLQTPSRFGKDG
ncbi:hypothetical protein M2416_005119 [Raoultella sp. BIGb0132]|nr:hypothetical protein [Raoultella sp. BIGb0132]MCS4291576.1 hypothetical protein [Raoultella terrigena]